MAVTANGDAFNQADEIPGYGDVGKLLCDHEADRSMCTPCAYQKGVCRAGVVGRYYYRAASRNRARSDSMRTIPESADEFVEIPDKAIGNSPLGIAQTNNESEKAACHQE